MAVWGRLTQYRFTQFHGEKPSAGSGRTVCDDGELSAALPDRVEQNLLSAEIQIGVNLYCSVEEGRGGGEEERGRCVLVVVEVSLL